MTQPDEKKFYFPLETEPPDHTPAQMAQAMAGLRFGVKALLDKVYLDAEGDMSHDDIAGRAHKAFIQVIQDFRYNRGKTDRFVDSDGDTAPFPLLIRANESIDVEFSPEPSVQPRPTLRDWQTLFVAEQPDVKSTCKEPIAAEDDFAGLDFLDSFIEPWDSTAKTLADQGDMRILEPVQKEALQAGDPTPLIPEDKLAGLLGAMEQSNTLTIPDSPMISIREPECLTDAIRLWVSEGQFQEGPEGTYIPKKHHEEPLDLDMEIFNRCFPEASSE